MPKANPYEDLGRLRKAQKLADALRDWDFTAEELEHLPDAGWLVLASHAKVKPPSQETQRMAIEFVRQREEKK
jgi:hypothetical protein